MILFGAGDLTLVSGQLAQPHQHPQAPLYTTSVHQDFVWLLTPLPSTKRNTLVTTNNVIDKRRALASRYTMTPHDYLRKQGAPKPHLCSSVAPPAVGIISGCDTRSETT